MIYSFRTKVENYHEGADDDGDIVMAMMVSRANFILVLYCCTSCDGRDLFLSVCVGWWHQLDFNIAQVHTIAMA